MTDSEWKERWREVERFVMAGKTTDGITTVLLFDIVSDLQGDLLDIVGDLEADLKELTDVEAPRASV
jgi:hypothetical protein